MGEGVKTRGTAGVEDEDKYERREERKKDRLWTCQDDIKKCRVKRMKNLASIVKIVFASG